MYYISGQISTEQHNIYFGTTTGEKDAEKLGPSILTTACTRIILEQKI